jgi:hypothetical protein
MARCQVAETENGVQIVPDLFGTSDDAPCGKLKPNVFEVQSQKYVEAVDVAIC